MVVGKSFSDGWDRRHLSHRKRLQQHSRMARVPATNGSKVKGGTCQHDFSKMSGVNVRRIIWSLVLLFLSPVSFEPLLIFHIWKAFFKAGCFSVTAPGPWFPLLVPPWLAVGQYAQHRRPLPHCQTGKGHGNRTYFTGMLCLAVWITFGSDVICLLCRMLYRE